MSPKTEAPARLRRDVPLAAGSVRQASRQILHFFGVDMAVFYSLVGRSLSVLTMPMTLFLMVRHLTAVEQGYYYTFNNVIGLTVFFELGLGYVLTQFVSHEKAYLEWTADGRLQGNERTRRRLSALIRKALVWYTAATILIVLLLLPAGYYFFQHEPGNADIAWRGPWLLMVVAAGSWCWISPWFSVLMGCGLVTQMQRNALVQQSGMALILWVALLSRAGLYALPLSLLFGPVFAAIWLASTKRPFVKDLLACPVSDDDINWRREIWPMQWKMAASWVSGYLLTQLFSPILFHYHGAEVAGRMGMTLTLTTALAATSIAWISTKAPIFGGLIAQRRFAELDALFTRSLWQSSLILGTGALAVWGVVAYLASVGHPYSQRILPPSLTALLLVTALAMHCANAQSFYLRAHKQEPLLPVSIANGVVMTATITLLGREGGARGMVIGYLLCSVVVNLGLTTWVFLEKRREWHRDDLLIPSDGALRLENK